MSAHAAAVCRGSVRGNDPPPNGTRATGTWSMLARHFVLRRGLRMPNVSALVPLQADHCWDHMCWEILSHSYVPPGRRAGEAPATPSERD